VSPLSSISKRLARDRVNETRIATPCAANWEEMQGDDKVRFCAVCRLNVYNLSAMDVEEAAEVLANREGRLCARFYRRKDGTLITQDCPVGVEFRNQRRTVVRTIGVAAGALVGFTALVPLRILSPTRTMGVVADISPEHATIYAAAEGDVETLQEQLADGWDPNSQLSSGVTALMLAASRGETKAMKLMIDHGADVNAQGFEGVTALHCAREADQKAAVKLLRAAGAL
jgi:hypothetical protein